MLKKILLLGSSAILAGSIAAPAFAQDIPEDEIIVTATKRTQTLQETPVAVTVTSANVIEKAQIHDINDLQAVVPSLRVSTNQNSAQSTFTIRGFGNGANNIGIEPSVGVFVDGVYRSRAASQIGDLPNLERVEVLRGPQSTLFGKNASAGVISIVTRKPQYTFGGSASASYGNYNTIIGKADITGPIGETAAFSLSGGFNKADGYAEGAVAGQPDVNDRNRFNLRGQLLFEPNDVFSARVIADYSEIDEICCHVTNIQNGPTAGIIRAVGGQLADPADPFAYRDFRDGTPENTVQDKGISLHMDYDLGNMSLVSITSYRQNESANRGDIDFTSAQLVVSNFDNDIKTFTQELRLQSTGDGPFSWLLGGYYFNEDVDSVNGLEYEAGLRSYLDILAGQGVPGTFANLEAGSQGLIPTGAIFNADTTTVESFTQKDKAFSLFGNFDYDVTERLTASIGLSYLEDRKDVTGSTVNGDFFSNIDLTGPTGIAILTTGGLAANFGAFSQSCIDPGTGTPFANPLAFSAANVGLVSTTQCFVPSLGMFVPGSAAFGGFQSAVAAGSAALAASPNNPLLGLQALQFQPQFLSFPNNVEGGSSKDTNLDYTFRLGYDAGDKVNLYASYATGYKSTSWNLSRDSRPLIADALALQGAGLLPNNYTFNTVNGAAVTPGAANFGTRRSEPEEATVYEFGIKTKFDWGFINVAVFQQSIVNFQTNSFIGSAFVFTNAEKQSTKGIELDSAIRLSDNFGMTFGATILDPVYDSYANAPGGDLTGQTPAGIPKVSFAVSGTYDFQVMENIDAYLRADFQHQGTTKIIDPFDITRQVNELGAVLGFQKDNYELSFWGRNLTGDESFQTIFPGVIQSFAGQVPTINGYPNRPTTYGGTLKLNF